MKLKYKYDKLELAERQLEAALVLYFGPKDYISALTLSGAAGEVFHQYLKLNNSKTITAGVANVFQKIGVPGIGVKKVRSALRNMSVNHLKHRKNKDPFYINMDYQYEARNNILMASIDYSEIFSRNMNFDINVLTRGLIDGFIKDAWKKPSLKRKWYKSIAITHLKTSINLFASEQYAASITLAGAADNIFISLLETKGKKCLSKIVKEERISNASVGEIRKEMNDLCAINAVKHLDSLEDRYIETNLSEDAHTAIIKTLPNYMNLDSSSYRKCYEVAWFLNWIKYNLDPKIYHVDKIKFAPKC